MKRLLLALACLLAIFSLRAQTIQKGDRFFDGIEIFTVQEVRMGKYVYMTTSEDNEMTLEKVDGKNGIYALCPSRQADEPPMGMKFGDQVAFIQQDGKGFLVFRNTKGEAIETFLLTTASEDECVDNQLNMGKKEDIEISGFIIPGVLFNRTYLQSINDKQTLRLMRNEILARHGYRFNSKDLQEWFAKKTWYKPGNNNDAIRLNAIELTNIQLIKNQEAVYTGSDSKAASSDLWTTEAVEAQIRACYDEVNKQGEGDGPYINRLDELFCSKDFLELRKQLSQKVKKGEVTFDGDEGWHWLPGVGTPINVDTVKAELLTANQAQAEVWLSDRRGNHGYLELNLYLEDGAWKIHNWIDSDVYPFGAYYHWMQNLIDGYTNDDEEE